jgi:hypothetical protein
MTSCSCEEEKNEEKRKYMKPNFSEEIEKLGKILNYLKKYNPSDDRSEKDII